MSQNFSDIIKINSKFCRSINIEKDLNNEGILKGFVCPNSFRTALRGLSENVGETGQAAFTWTGPYGSGKSSLALLLSSLLGENKNLHDMAIDIIGQDEADAFFKGINYKSGWTVLPIVGDVEDPKKLIDDELKKHLKTKPKDTFDGLEKLATQKDGLLIVIDEMGKCLEAQAKGIGEVYFFQKLAEFASRSNGKIILIGILHQSFVDYARSLPHTIRDEWSKIQGRFVDVPINTAGEEQLELIGRAINTPSPDLSKIKPIAEQVADTIAKNKHIISKDDLIDVLCRCWPICPVVVCLLGQLSRKKFGQNQRSIFSFLSSAEPYAFRDFINSTPYSKDTMYTLSNLFDYIKTNLESLIVTSSESKIWHIAMEAIQKISARDFPEFHLDVLKSIVMIDIFSGSSGLVASKDLLSALFPETKKLDTAIKDLEKASVILYKAHKGAYSVFEGSDFDIDSAFREAFKHIDGLETSKLAEIVSFKPVIAKRYYHQYGSMRWFDVVLTSISDYKQTIENACKSTNAVGLFCILLPNGQAEEKQAETILLKNKDKFDLPVFFSVAKQARLINEHLRELLALEWIQKSALPGFVGDTIAQKIVEDRLNAVSDMLGIRLEEVIQGADWYHAGNKYENVQTSRMSAIASDVCEEKYKYSPRIRSELVNKNKPSASANTALNKLLKMMVNNNGEQDLGITGFSTEAGLLKILLQDTELYINNTKNGGDYVLPKKGSELYNLWKGTDDFLKTSFSKTAAEIYNMWKAEPYGVKAGLHTILMLAYILTKTKDIAAYRDGIYTPKVDDLFVDYLIKDSKRISLKFVEADDVSNNIIMSVVKALQDVGINEQLTEPLDVARKLVSMVRGLHPWVLKTKTLTNQTIRFREIIKSANDPNKLLFEDLPKLYSSNNLYENVKAALVELSDVYPAMLQAIGILMTSELDIPLVTPFYLEELRERAKNIKGVTGNFGIEAFAARLSTFNSTTADIAGIISLASNKPQTEWIDLDIETAKKEILRLCTEFKKAELYAKVKGRPATRQAIAFIAGIGDSAEVISGDFDLLTTKTKEVTALKDKLGKILKEERDNALILTALSELSIEILKQKKE